MTSATSPLPSGMPVLSAGRHTRPEDGSCLMEYVSLLAGRRFSDHPRCTHPRLSWLARQVNDLVADDIRQRLAVLAPDLIGTRERGRGIRAVVFEELARIGLAADPGNRHLQDLAQLAAEHLEPRTDPSKNETLEAASPQRCRRGHRPRRIRQLVDTKNCATAFSLVADAMAGLPHAVRDELLVEALTRSVRRSQARVHLGRPGDDLTPAGPDRSRAASLSRIQGSGSAESGCV